MNLSVLGCGRTSKWGLLLPVSHRTIDVLPVLYWPSNKTWGLDSNSSAVIGRALKCSKWDFDSAGRTERL